MRNVKNTSKYNDYDLNLWKSVGAGLSRQSFASLYRHAIAQSNMARNAHRDDSVSLIRSALVSCRSASKSHQRGYMDEF